jgi:hypothetical protein
MEEPSEIPGLAGTGRLLAEPFGADPEKGQKIKELID